MHNRWYWILNDQNSHTNIHIWFGRLIFCISYLGVYEKHLIGYEMIISYLKYEFTNSYDRRRSKSSCKILQPIFLSVASILIGFSLFRKPPTIIWFFIEIFVYEIHANELYLRCQVQSSANTLEALDNVGRSNIDSEATKYDLWLIWVRHWLDLPGRWSLMASCFTTNLDKLLPKFMICMLSSSCKFTYNACILILFIYFATKAHIMHMCT